MLFIMPLKAVSVQSARPDRISAGRSTRLRKAKRTDGTSRRVDARNVASGIDYRLAPSRDITI
jgi:hypothetical protein